MRPGPLPKVKTKRFASILKELGKKSPPRPADPDGHVRLSESDLALALMLVKVKGAIWVAARTGQTPDWVEKIVTVGCDPVRMMGFVVLLRSIVDA
jgi:hypothetical protein